MIEIDELTGIIIDTAISIHKGLGPGLLESVYEAVMYAKLSERGLRVDKQVPVDFIYEGISFKEGFRADLLVENRVVIELKSVEKVSPVHSKQLLTYMRLMDIEVGLLINFGEALLKNGIHRVVNKFKPSTTSSLRVNQ